VQNFIDRNQQHAQKLIEPIVTPLRPVVNDLVETEPVQSFMQQALTTMKNALAAKENYYDNNLRSGRNFEGDSFANIMMYNNGDDDIDIPAPHTAFPKHAAPHFEYPQVQHTPTNYADSEPGEDPEDNPGMQMSAGEDPILYAKAMQPQIQRPLQLSNPYTPQPAYKPQRPLPVNDRSLNNGQPANNGMPTYNRMPVNNRKPVNNRQPANSGVPVNNRIPATSTVSGNNRQYQPLNNQQGRTQYKAGLQSNRNVNSAGIRTFNTQNSNSNTMQANTVNNHWNKLNNGGNMNLNKPNLNTNRLNNRPNINTKTSSGNRNWNNRFTTNNRAKLNNGANRNKNWANQNRVNQLNNRWR